MELIAAQYRGRARVLQAKLFVLVVTAGYKVTKVEETHAKKNTISQYEFRIIFDLVNIELVKIVAKKKLINLIKK